MKSHASRTAPTRANRRANATPIPAATSNGPANCATVATTTGDPGNTNTTNNTTVPTTHDTVIADRAPNAINAGCNT